MSSDLLPKGLFFGIETIYFGQDLKKKNTKQLFFTKLTVFCFGRSRIRQCYQHGLLDFKLRFLDFKYGLLDFELGLLDFKHA